MSIVATRLVFLFLFPALVTAAFITLAARPWSNAKRARAPAWGAPIGLAAAFMIGFVGLIGRPAFPPAESWQWTFYLAPVVAILSLGLALPRFHWTAQAALVLAVATAVSWLTVPGWYERLTMGRVSVVVAIVAMTWTLIPLAARIPTTALMWILGPVAAASALLLAASANAKLAELCGAMTVSLGVTLILTWFRSNWIDATTVPMTFVALIAALLFNGFANNYGDVPTAAFILIFISPAAAWVAEVAAIRRMGAWPRGVIRLAVVVLPIAVALWLAHTVASGEGDQSGPGY